MGYEISSLEDYRKIAKDYLVRRYGMWPTKVFMIKLDLKNSILLVNYRVRIQRWSGRMTAEIPLDIVSVPDESVKAEEKGIWLKLRNYILKMGLTALKFILTKKKSMDLIFKKSLP